MFFLSTAGLAGNIAWVFIQLGVKIGGQVRGRARNCTPTSQAAHGFESDNQPWAYICLLQAGILSCVYLVTALLTELLTNNAAAAIMYPIASLAGKALGEEWEGQGAPNHQMRQTWGEE